MESILTLKKDYSDKVINLLFKSKVTKDKVEAVIYKMLYSFEYNDFFKLQGKYNVVVSVDNSFNISIKTNDDYIFLSLSSLEVIEVN